MVSTRKTDFKSKKSVMATIDSLTEQETTKDGMAGMQSKFQNLNTKVNQNVVIRQTGRWISIYRQKLLCNKAN